MKRDLQYGTILIMLFLFGALISAYSISASDASSALDLLCRYSSIDDLQPGSTGMLAAIFFKNLLACSMVALFSWLAYGLTIYMFIVINAVTLGIVFSVAGWSWETISYLMPHAPFELTAILISLGIGWRILRSGQTPVRRDIILFARVVFPLLLGAAFLETYLTPVFVAMAK